MFSERFGNMWDFASEYEAVCILTNMQVDTRGRNIMGRGSAFEAKEKLSWLPQAIGHQIQLSHDAGLQIPAIITVTSGLPYAMVAFMTKHKWRLKSDPQLIERSAHALMREIERHRWSKVLLPRPGCGAGQLDWERDVKPILVPILDDRVTIVAFGGRTP